MTATTLILLAFTYLVVKHTVADFFLQFAYQHENKGRYGHPGGLLHASIHIVMTVPVFLILPPPAPGLAMAGYILAGEFLVHYHLDWAKKNFVVNRGWTTKDDWFWRIFGLDQLGHLLTYVVIIALLIP